MQYRQLHSDHKLSTISIIAGNFKSGSCRRQRWALVSASAVRAHTHTHARARWCVCVCVFMNWLRIMSPGRFFSRFAEKAWPSMSPDFFSPDYFLWGYFIKFKCRQTNFTRLESWNAHTSDAIRVTGKCLLATDTDIMRRDRKEV
jgi:hypothetical protein